MNLNKAIIIGRLTKNPELRETESGTPVTNFSIASNRYWTNDNGEKKESTEFHDVVVWGRKAETVSQFLNKGDLAMVEGRLQTRNWKDRDGNKRRTTEIVAQNIQFGPNKDKNKSSKHERPIPKKEKESKLPKIEIDPNDEEIDPDDIPF